MSSTDLGPDGPGLGADLLGDSTPDEQVALTADWGGSRRVRAAGPRLGPAGWLRWVWRQLTSMRTALVLLLLLALAAIPGSVLPQRPNAPLAVNAWTEANPRVAPTLDRLFLFDVFSSPWFAAIYILLFISLIGCVLPRIGVHWHSMRAPRHRRPAASIGWRAPGRGPPTTRTSWPRPPPRCGPTAGG